MYRLRFADINNPELGGTITALLDGTEGPKMMDNIGIDNFGHLLIQEDPGNQSYVAKIWQYTIATDAVKVVGEHDQTRFTAGSSNFLTQDEESSGIIDMQKILGPGMYILYDQAHYAQAGEVVEGGQLLAFYNPDTYLDNPEIIVSGNNEEIKNGSISAKQFDNTDFGGIVKGSQKSLSYELGNIAVGSLKVSSITIEGANAADFTIEAAPTMPATIASGSSTVLTVKFKPSALGLRVATIKVVSNDVDESVYTFNVEGTGIFNTEITDENISKLTIYPNPSSSEATISLGVVNASELEVSLIDINGKLVMPVSNYSLENGEHQITLNTADISNGLYIVELKVNGVVSRYRLSVIH
ncbi:MAG: choice-of-anchor D domain-containing protein, partial [Chitinophagaceae bacterium]